MLDSNLDKVTKLIKAKKSIENFLRHMEEGTGSLQFYIKNNGSAAPLYTVNDERVKPSDTVEAVMKVQLQEEVAKINAALKVLGVETS